MKDLTNKARAGFTLIELMVVMLIFSIISAAIFAVLAMGRQSWQIGTTRVEVQQEARKAMDSMLRDLRGASSIDPGTFVAGVSDDIIRFTLQGTQIEFALNPAGQLQRIESGVTTILANHVNAIQFELFGNNVVYLTLTTRKNTILGHSVEMSLNSQVVLRN
jgi:prepilin-type N-terminal cleavage/methylation domain-containing protein